MNHTRIAAEALSYRLRMVRRPLVQGDEWDLECMAGRTVAAGDPVVDGAIRRLATAWIDAGLEPTHLCVSWQHPTVDALFSDNPHLVDALDDILRFATRGTSVGHPAA